MDRKPRWLPRRIAWLLTHSALRSAEVPVLRSLGCEVWTQKLFPDRAGYRSNSTDLSWDAGLSLPAEDLAALNAFDFYTRTIPRRIAGLLNEHFDLVVIDVEPLKTREILKAYRGPVLARAFGMPHPWKYGFTYFHKRTRGLLDALRTHYRRYWFGAFYPEVLPYEPAALRERGFHLPITLPEEAWAREGTWVGGDRRILFVCPRINEEAYSRRVYNAFKDGFGELPHAIGGKQPVPVADPSILGFLDGVAYAELYRRVQVMFYSSREPRHLHYHPVEAMASGMPVVYMRGGLLEGYDTGSQAGACATEDEARAKLRRVLDGDAHLIAAIRESQRTVVDRWRPEGVRQAWADWFSLFAPEANGVVPAHQLWQNFMPAPAADDLREMGWLDNRGPREPNVVMLWLGAFGRYLRQVVIQRTFLPRGQRKAEVMRRVLGRLLGWPSPPPPPADKAA